MTDKQTNKQTNAYTNTQTYTTENNTTLSARLVIDIQLFASDKDVPTLHNNLVLFILHMIPSAFLISPPYVWCLSIVTIGLVTFGRRYIMITRVCSWLTGCWVGWFVRS